MIALRAFDATDVALVLHFLALWQRMFEEALASRVTIPAPLLPEFSRLWEVVETEGDGLLMIGGLLEVLQEGFMTWLNLYLHRRRGCCEPGGLGLGLLEIVGLVVSPERPFFREVLPPIFGTVPVALALLEVGGSVTRLQILNGLQHRHSTPVGRPGNVVLVKRLDQYVGLTVLPS